ncbi:MAG TPA: 4-hydroxy-3-methylbut-2-enyl diphosphate reductase [Dehalococcoidia bacterium]|nr:4-hydroxy-3-methylbut-2-enyl diphosphate reductase [Dehalococcoidia bacterium]
MAIAHNIAVNRVLLASPRGFCAGVDRAIEIVRLTLDVYGPPVYVFHEIVHNPYVVNALREKGAIFVNGLSEVPPGARTIYSAHGVSPQVRAQAQERGLQVIDATCPLVTKVHLEAVRFDQDGYFNILVGHKGHDEVVGTMGEVPGSIVLVSTVEEAEAVTVPDPLRVAVLTQTTLSVDDTKDIIETLQRRFPSLIFPQKEDICYATQNRQAAVRELAAQVDLVLVLGASNSSNSQRLREVAEQSGVASHLINDIEALQPAWLEGVKTVGITSGASTPEFLVQQAIEYFQKSGAAEVRLLDTVKERVHFTLPRELRAV